MTEGKFSSWGSDDLSRFMTVAERRLRETHRDDPDWWNRLSRIESIYSRAGDSLNEAAEMVPALLLLRAHSAFMAGVRLAASGQLPESYMVLRGCLELGLYALYIGDDKRREQLWLTRTSCDENQKRFLSEFSGRGLLRYAELRSQSTGSLARKLYARQIAFGAHPNDYAIGGTTTIAETEDSTRFETSLIAAAGLPASAALKNACHIGICTLRLFHLVFKERFEILGLDKDLDQASQGL